VGEAHKSVGQPGGWIEAFELAAFDERGHDGPVFTTLVRVREQVIYAIESEGADRALDGVVVEVDTSIGEEQCEPIPTGKRIADCLADLAFGADRAVAGIEIHAPIIADHSVAFVAESAPLFGARAADAVFDGVERREGPTVAPGVAKSSPPERRSPNGLHRPAFPISTIPCRLPERPVFG